MEINRISQVGQDIASDLEVRPNVVEQTQQVAQEQQQESRKVSREQAEEVVVGMSELATQQSFMRELSFTVDSDSKRTIVSVLDSESGDVIRQIPSEEILRIAERLKTVQTDNDVPVGVLVNKSV